MTLFFSCKDILLLLVMQIVLPLGDEPSKRAGKNPKQASEEYPIEGKKITSQTGEVGIVRRRPDMDALKEDLQVSHAVMNPVLIYRKRILDLMFSTRCSVGSGDFLTGNSQVSLPERGIILILLLQLGQGCIKSSLLCLLAMQESAAVIHIECPGQLRA